MNEQERVQAAIAEYNQFVQALQARYGVVVEPCITTQEFPGRPPKRILSINIDVIEGWQPPVPPNIVVDNGAVIMPDAEPPSA